jgi:glycerate 2-kinase
MSAKTPETGTVSIRLRRDALAVFRAGLQAADPERAVLRHLSLDGPVLRVAEREYNLEEYRRILVVGAGKATASLARAVEDVLGGRLTEGLINVKYGHTLPLNRIRIREAGHPVPDQAGWDGARDMAALLEGAQQDDLVICLLSGGGSALLPSPVEGLALQEIREMTQLLLDSGATIQEINTLRKHLSLLKGGRMARLAHPATLVSLILSDVVGDDLSSIASGPTVPDPTTYADCLGLLDRLGLIGRISGGILKYLEQGAAGGIDDTPKPGDVVFSKTQNLIVANNHQALQAARREAERLGYHTLVLSSFMEGETRDVALVHAACAREVLATGNPAPPPACLLSGGETTVTIKGDGRGGRNQEFVLAAALALEGLEGVVVLSAGTDGTDGPTDAAGAVADGQTVSRALHMGLTPDRCLANNDSYTFFQSLDDLVVTGPTLTNVMDLRIVLVDG